MPTVTSHEMRGRGTRAILTAMASETPDSREFRAAARRAVAPTSARRSDRRRGQPRRRQRAGPRARRRLAELMRRAVRHRRRGDRRAASSRSRPTPRAEPCSRCATDALALAVRRRAARRCRRSTFYDLRMALASNRAGGMKERPKGTVGRATAVAEGVADAVRRRQREREPRACCSTAARVPARAAPGRQGHDEAIELAERIVALVGEEGAERRLAARATPAGASGAPSASDASRPRSCGAALERALAHGGDLAEVYAEDRRGIQPVARRGRVERPPAGASAACRSASSGARRAGSVTWTGSRRPNCSRVAASVAGAVRGEPRGAAPLVPPAAAAGHAIAEPPEDGRGRPQGGRCCAPARNAHAPPAPEVAQASISYTREPPDRRDLQLGRRRRRRRPDASAPVRPGGCAPGMEAVETGSDTRGGHAGFELLADEPELVAEQAARQAH